MQETDFAAHFICSRLMTYPQTSQNVRMTCPVRIYPKQYLIEMRLEFEVNHRKKNHFGRILRPAGVVPQHKPTGYQNRHRHNTGKPKSLCVAPPIIHQLLRCVG
eukprot:scaffold5585_cov57-Attheya_sp.AAC.8